MAQQSSNGNGPKLSEKGLLTPDNCVVAMIDHQGQMLFGTSNFERQGIINNTVAFGKAARVFDVPVVLTTVETKSFSGNMWPQLRAVFPGQEPIERFSMNWWDDKNFVAAIEKTGRKKVVLASLWTATCVALPTVQAINDGYEIYVVEDCCGDVSQLAHDNAMKRVIQAGTLINGTCGPATSSRRRSWHGTAFLRRRLGNERLQPIWSAIYLWRAAQPLRELYRTPCLE